MLPDAHPPDRQQWLPHYTAVVSPLESGAGSDQQARRDKLAGSERDRYRLWMSSSFLRNDPASTSPGHEAGRSARIVRSDEPVAHFVAVLVRMAVEVALDELSDGRHVDWQRRGGSSPAPWSRAFPGRSSHSYASGSDPQCAAHGERHAEWPRALVGLRSRVTICTSGCWRNQVATVSSAQSAKSAKRRCVSRSTRIVP